MIINSRFFNRTELMGFVALAVLLFLVLPLSLDVFRLNLVAKYLTYAFVAIGLVLCWGYGGILSLGQGVFFGLGGYCMAMFLKLEASSVANTKIQSTPGIPDFMDWNQITQLPLFWKPFHSFSLTVLAILLVPSIFAFIIGAAMFKRRVGGVYFAIITQAIAAILTILIVGQQGYTGGINGITDLRTLHGWDIRTDHAKFILYFVEVVLLFGCIIARRSSSGSQNSAACWWPCATRRTGCASPATTWPISRFSSSALAAVFAAIGGAMFTLEGRLHVAVLRRHRAVDRDGDLHRGRWPDVDLRRGVRLAAGQFRQDLLLGDPSRSFGCSSSARCSSRSCWPSRTACPGIWQDYVQPRIDRLLSSRKSKPGNGYPVADGAPAE